VRQNPFHRTVRSVHVCALHCAQLLLHTVLHKTDLIIFRLTLQAITIAPMMSISGKEWQFPSSLPLSLLSLLPSQAPLVISSTTFTHCDAKTTDFGKITQNKGHYAAQGHSRSPILVTKMSTAPFWMQAINVLKSFSNHRFMIHLIIKKLN